MVAEVTSPGLWRRARHLMSSVRFRITAVATVIVAAVLVLTALGLLGVQRRALLDNVDATLRQRADDLQALVETNAIPPVLANQGEDDTVAQIVDSSGAALAASSNLVGAEAIGTPPGSTETFETTPLPRLDSEDDFRVFARAVSGPEGETTLYVAANLSDVTEPVATLAATLAIAFPAVLVVLAALIWLVLGRVLEPVEDIRREADQISGSELHRRVPIGDVDNEISRLGRTVNEMLDRLEASQTRQRRFVADAAHELRSPLTNMRSELEVDGRDYSQADLAATHESVLEETIRLQRLVNDLLHLARSDARALPRSDTAVDLDDIVLREAERLRQTPDVDVDTSRVSAAQTVGDARSLERAIRNLGDNAQRHAEKTITFELRENSGAAHLVVADDGPGIPPDKRDEIFERFTRLDTARDRGSGGTGLGLAIAKDIIEAHSGAITVEGAGHGDRGARFCITLPTAVPEHATTT